MRLHYALMSTLRVAVSYSKSGFLPYVSPVLAAIAALFDSECFAVYFKLSDSCPIASLLIHSAGLRNGTRSAVISRLCRAV